MNSRNYGCRITSDLVINGNRAVVMENQLLRLTILTDRGSDIIELLYKPMDVDFMWRSPSGLHKKADYISSTGDSLGNYLDHNSGGWQEILPNGGSECYYKGACLGMHGEISNVPWKCEILMDTKEEIKIKFSIKTLRSPFFLEKEIGLKENESIIYIDERLSNLANESMELMWGQHPTIGEPFLDESCKIITNATKGFTLEDQSFTTQRLAPSTEFSWPEAISYNGECVDLSKIPKSDNKTADMLYLTGFPKAAEYEIHNENMGLSMGMKWDGERFPYAWMWLVCGGAQGYPWYGRTYNLALEPWSSYSKNNLTGAIENGSSLKMKALETIDTSFTLWVGEKK